MPCPSYKLEPHVVCPPRRLKARPFLLRQLDMLLELRPKAKAVMIAEARQQPEWEVLGSMPFFGPVGVAGQLL